MPKLCAGSKTSDLHVSRPSMPPENRSNLYAKTADIPGVLTVVDVPEKVAISHAHSATISRVLIVVEVPENRANLYADPADIPATVILLDSICSGPITA